MNKTTISCVVLIYASLCSVVLAQVPIIISDGPNTSSSHSNQKIDVSNGPGTGTSSKPKIITTDGPSTLPYVYPPPIVISNGPAHLFYENSPNATKVVTSDGPSKAGNSLKSSSPKIVIIDGPEPVLPVKHATKKSTGRKWATKKKAPVPDPETSALAPVIPSAVPVNSPAPAVSPSVSEPIPAKSPFASGAAWVTIALMSILVLSLLGTLLLKRQKA